MRWLLALSFVFSTGCESCKGDPEKCDRAARNYAQLVFWDKANKEIEALPVDQRDAVRKDKLAEFTKNVEQNIDVIVSKCVSANNKDQINCMIEAKSAAAAKKCQDE
jgi:hypothetical protein